MLEKNSVHLRIDFDDGTSKFFTCAGNHRTNSGRVYEVFSYRHATKCGWRFTRHITYAPPGETAAVCPECAERTFH